MRNSDSTARAKRNRRELSSTESKLWRLLRDRRFSDFKFRRQHPIGLYVVDFACVSARLVLEADGLSHTIEEQAAFDATRTAFLETAGWRVLRVRNADVDADPSGVAAAILSALQAGAPVRARYDRE